MSKEQKKVREHPEYGDFHLSDTELDFACAIMATNTVAGAADYAGCKGKGRNVLKRKEVQRWLRMVHDHIGKILGKQAMPNACLKRIGA